MGANEGDLPLLVPSYESLSTGTGREGDGALRFVVSGRKGDGSSLPGEDKIMPDPEERDALSGAKGQRLGEDRDGTGVANFIDACEDLLVDQGDSDGDSCQESQDNPNDDQENVLAPPRTPRATFFGRRPGCGRLRRGGHATCRSHFVGAVMSGQCPKE